MIWIYDNNNHPPTASHSKMWFMKSIAFDICANWINRTNNQNSSIEIEEEKNSFSILNQLNACLHVNLPESSCELKLIIP